MSPELSAFVREALAGGIERSQIAEALRHAGWSEADVRSALGTFADLSFPIPVPKPKAYLSAREVFLYLLMFGALYVCAWHLGTLIFSVIDHAFPDPVILGFRDFTDSVRWDVSALVVLLPLFLFTFQVTERNIAADPTKSSSRPRRWLTYLTLLIAAGTGAGDLVVLVYNVLGGEYGIRFLLKIATVAIIAGGIFSYFLSEMHREEA